jgi:hypothetical protein
MAWALLRGAKLVKKMHMSAILADCVFGTPIENG